MQHVPWSVVHILDRIKGIMSYDILHDWHDYIISGAQIVFLVWLSSNNIAVLLYSRQSNHLRNSTKLHDFL